MPNRTFSVCRFSVALRFSYSKTQLILCRFDGQGRFSDIF